MWRDRKHSARLEELGYSTHILLMSSFPLLQDKTVTLLHLVIHVTLRTGEEVGH